MAATNPYYTDTFTGVSGQTARAESVQTELDGIQGGFDGVNVDVVRAIKAPEGETLNDLPAALSRRNQWLRFDANGQPSPVQAPFNWRGQWQAGQVYFIGDVVQIGPRQNIVYSLSQHTSAATYALDAANWSVFIDLSGVPFENYSLVNAAGTTQLGKADAVFVDCSGGNVVLNLPLAPVVGDAGVTITHVKGTLAAGQSFTIQTADGTKIMGTTESQLAVDVANASMRLSYAGAAYGWRLRIMG